MLIPIYINGFQWYLDVVEKPNRLYPTSNKREHEGYSIYSKHFTENEKQQIYKFIKYQL